MNEQHKKQLDTTNRGGMKMATKLQIEAIKRIIGPTEFPIDGHLRIAAVAYGKRMGCEAIARAMVLKARFDWLDYRTMIQRKWQMETKNPNKARHHDSIEIREKYVRCIK
jgi:hypothetical protein